MMNRAAASRFGLGSPWGRGLVALGSVVAYTAAFFALYPRLSNEVAALSVIPQLAIAWLWGVRGGLIGAAFGFVLNTVLLYLVGHPVTNWRALPAEAGPGVAALLLVGLTVGRLRDLGLERTRQLDDRKRIEAALREKELRLRVVIEQTPAILWSTDKALRFTSSLGAGLKALRLQSNQVVGMSLYEFYKTRDSDFPPIAAHRRALKGESVNYQVEWAGRIFQSHVEPFRDPDGTVTGCVGTAVDVTDRQGTEAALRKSEERFRALFEHSSDAVALMAADSTIVYAGPTTERVLGYTPAEFEGMTRGELIHPDDQDLMRSRTTQLIQQPGSMVTLEFRVRHKDGSWRWVESTATNLLNNPTIQAIVLNYRDITGRKQVEEAMRESVARNAAILDAALDAVITIDHEGKIVEFNPAAERIFGYSRGEVIGKIMADLIIPPDLREAHRRGLARYLATGEGPVLGKRLELRALRADGLEFPVELAITRLPSDGPPMFTGYARDITERKRAEDNRLAKEAADEANRAKSEFLSRMSHELRTPLNAILGFAQLLQMDSLAAEQRESVEQILKGGRHLLDLINEVLDISRIETSRLAISIEPVQVREAAKDALDLITPLAVEQGVHLDEGTAAIGDGVVFADYQRLKQILLNLLSNAVKYNHRGGTVALSSEKTPEGRLRITVRDTGPGISPEMVGRLFVPFERLGAGQAGIEGTGLGLALSKRLVEAMGGTIGVESAVGSGSKFWIDLVAVEGAAERPKPAARGVPAPASADVKVERLVADVPAEAEHAQYHRVQIVLYLEHNLASIKLFKALLAHRPEVRLIPVMLGRLGLDLARNHRPHLILLDPNLPDMPGDEVLRQLRAAPETRTIPVVVIGTDVSPGRLERLLAEGARDCLAKPFDFKKLLTILEEMSKEGAYPNA